MQTQKHKVLLIMADDIGCFHVAAHRRGIMGSAHRISAASLPWVPGASGTASRAGSITGQIPLGTGLTARHPVAA